MPLEILKSNQGIDVRSDGLSFDISVSGDEKTLYVEGDENKIFDLFDFHFDELSSEFFLFDLGVGDIVDLVSDNIINGIVKVKIIEFGLCVGFTFNLENDWWVEKWSTSYHLTEFKKQVDKRFNGLVFWEDYPANEDDVFSSDRSKLWPYLFFRHDVNELKLKDVMSSDLKLMQEVHSLLKKKLRLLFVDENKSVIEFFEFPASVSFACKQYLIYFGQFLRDLGINASTSIQDGNSGKVLFSVTPDDQKQALSQIRDALEIYLNLPRNTSITPFDVQPDISVQQLVSNIYHLKSQLALAAATIQQKELLIGQQQSMISNQLLSGEILVKSMAQLVVASQNNDDEKENVIGDIVAVRKADWGFVQVDLPTLMRRLKQVFGKGKDK
jgi:hypothetical protein